MTVKELINIVLDSPFYLMMPIQERKDYIQSFVALYMKEEKNAGSQKGKRANLSVSSSYFRGTG